MVSRQAYPLLSNLLAPVKPATKNYDETTTKLKSTVTVERFKLHERTQAEAESVSEFMTVLRKMADKCEFRGHLEEAMRDRLVADFGAELRIYKRNYWPKVTLPCRRPMKWHMAWKRQLYKPS